jgi:hypothetical protein
MAYDVPLFGATSIIMERFGIGEVNIFRADGSYVTERGVLLVPGQDPRRAPVPCRPPVWPERRPSWLEPSRDHAAVLRDDDRIPAGPLHRQPLQRLDTREARDELGLHHGAADRHAGL